MTTMLQTKKSLDDQHIFRKKQIDEMIERMGRTEFIEFYQIAHNMINKEELSVERVEWLIENAPKYIAWLLAVVNTQMEKLGFNFGGKQNAKETNDNRTAYDDDWMSDNNGV